MVPEVIKKTKDGKNFPQCGMPLNGRRVYMLPADAKHFEACLAPLQLLQVFVVEYVAALIRFRLL